MFICDSDDSDGCNSSDVSYVCLPVYNQGSDAASAMQMAVVLYPWLGCWDVFPWFGCWDEVMRVYPWLGCWDEVMMVYPWLGCWDEVMKPVNYSIVCHMIIVYDFSPALTIYDPFLLLFFPCLPEGPVSLFKPLSARFLIVTMAWRDSCSSHLSNVGHKNSLTCILLHKST